MRSAGSIQKCRCPPAKLKHNGFTVIENAPEEHDAYVNHDEPTEVPVAESTATRMSTTSKNLRDEWLDYVLSQCGHDTRLIIN